MEYTKENINNITFKFQGSLYTIHHQDGDRYELLRKGLTSIPGHNSQHLINCLHDGSFEPINQPVDINSYSIWN